MHKKKELKGRKKERKKYRQADKQTSRQKDRQKDRQTGMQTDTQTGKQIDRQIVRQTDRLDRLDLTPMGTFTERTRSMGTTVIVDIYFNISYTAKISQLTR